MSAAFILIGSKFGDLFGRKRAYVLGLLGYAIGALAMVVAQGLAALIVFWAIVGGLGASLLLPAMQSLIHGNFEGAVRTRVYALVGASAAIAAAVGPLLGGFITTYLSWRVGFLLEAVVIAVVLSGIRLVRDVPYTGPRTVDGGQRGPVGAGDGRRRARHPRVAGGRGVGRRLFIAVGAVALARAGAAGSCGASARASRRSSIRTCSAPRTSGLGISGQLLQQIAPRRRDHRAADLPADGARVQRDGGRACRSRRSRSRCSASRCSPGSAAAGGGRAASSALGFALLTRRDGDPVPIIPRADSGWALAIPLIIAGSGLGLLVSQLNNYTLSPIADERVERGRRRQLGGGVVRALVRPRLRRRDHARHALDRVHQHGESSTVLPAGRPAAGRRRARGRRAGDEQHRSSRSCSPAQPPGRSRRRSSASTPTRGRSRSRSRSSSRSSRACSGSSPRSG